MILFLQWQFLACDLGEGNPAVDSTWLEEDGQLMLMNIQLIVHTSLESKLKKKNVTAINLGCVLMLPATFCASTTFIYRDKSMW